MPVTYKPDFIRNRKPISRFASLLMAGSALFFPFLAQADTPTVDTYNASHPGSGSWTCPAGVNLVQVEVWGGGGGGGAAYKTSKNGIAGGGGGGAYARLNAYSVSSANNPYPYSVGAAGTGGTYNSSVNTSGTSGGDSWFVINTTLDALGGTFAANVAGVTGGGLGAGGNGGTQGGTGDAHFAGGNGASGVSSGNTAGGGGGSAGYSSAGNPASGSTGGTAVTGGGAGGTGASGTTTISAGSPPGGGGGGARDTSGGGSTGAAGGSGQVQFTYYVTPTTQASGVSFSSVGSANMVISWTPGNVGSSLVLVKAGSAVNSAPVNGTIYTPNSAFGSGSQLGTGNYVVYQGTGNTVTISGLAVGTTYYVAVYAVNGAGTVLAEYLTSSPATGNQTTVSVPSLNSPTKSGLSLNSVTLGATVTSANGGTITEYGIVWNTTGNPTTSDHKVVAGTSVTPPSTFTVSATGLPVGSTIYYAGYATSSAGTGYSLSDSFTYSPQLYWATTSGTWNVNSSGNLIWQDAAASTTYYQDGDQVVFNDTGSGTVTLNSTVNPASLMASNNLSAYTITGSGAIAGSISLTKLGTNTLTLGTANTYTGGTTNSAGTLVLGNAAAIGTGTLTMNGGNLDSSAVNLDNANNNSQAWNADFTFAGSQNLNLGTGNVALGASRQVTVSANTLTVGGIISGANFGLTKTGNGTLALLNTNTYTGGTTVNGGVLVLPSGNGSGGVGSIIGSLTVNGGAEAQSGNAWSLGYGKNYVTNIVLNGGTLTFTGGSSYPNDTGFAGTNLTLTGATVQANNGGSGFDFYSGSGASQTTYVNVLASSVTSVISCETDLRVGAGGSLVFNVAGGGNGDDLLISGAIVAGGGSKAGGSILKAGNGIMTLSAVNTCANPITVNAGKLVGVTTGSCAGSALTVAAGATNTVQLAGAGGHFTCNGLTCNSGTTYQEFDFQNNAPSATTAPLNVTGSGSGTLTASGTVEVSLLNAPAWTAPGSYPLIHYTGTAPSVSSFSLLTPLPANVNGGLTVDTGNQNVSLAIKLIAPNLSYTLAPKTGLRINLADIQAQLQSSLGSPSYAFTGVSATSAQGGAVAFTGTSVQYTAPSSGSPAGDSFTYTVSDGVESATATVSLAFQAQGGGSSGSISVSGGVASVKLFGIQGLQYDVQRSTDLVHWTTFTSTSSPQPISPAPPITPGADGSFSFTDSFSDLGSPPSSASYRLIQH